MGNRASMTERHNTTALFSAATPTGLPVKFRLSEEDYLPMTPAMRERLLAGKRFQHVVPKRGGGVDVKKAKQPEEGKKCNTEKENSSVTEVQKDEKVVKEVVFEVENEESGKKNKTVGEEPSAGSQSRSLGALGETGGEQQSHLYFMKSPTLTNRRYSLMDMRLSEAKSQFTMKLKDRLRQSKLELGFDEEFLNWKEFVYKDNPGGRNSMERRVNFSASHEVLDDKNSSRIDPKRVEVMDYCAHNCQILGLCGVKRTRVDTFPKLNRCESPAFVDDAIGKNNLHSIQKTHKRKDSCNCEVCTLAYLTDMGFPDHDYHEAGTEIAELGERDVPLEESVTKPVQWLKSPGRDSVANRCGKGYGSVRESVRLVDVDDPNKTVEVKIYSGRSNKSDGKFTGNNTIIASSSRSSVSRTSFEEDSTNLKIRRLFQRYGNNTRTHPNPQRAAVAPVPDSHRSSYDGVSIVNISTDQEYKVSNRCHMQTPKTKGNRSPGEKRTDPLVTRYVREPSSSSVLVGPSTSSSLSTIMSYKRVKQIFQTIIEKNRPRKRTKKNLHKFLEMEELGLGEVRNNRWYPSDSKTKAIWNDITSARGVQAQFRKCHYHNHASRIP